jgi:ABC-type Na+ transport system ATPase subunit NatA
MKIVEEIKEYEIKKLPEGDYVILFYKQNDQEFLENCDRVLWFLDKGFMVIEFEHKKLPKRFEFKNIEKRTRYLLNKNQLLTFIEIDTNEDNPSINYTVNKKIDI